MATLWAVAHCFQLKSNSEYNYEKNNKEKHRNKKGNEQERRTTMHTRDTRQYIIESVAYPQ